MGEVELDLPLAGQGVGRFTQWIVAAATSLAVLALAVAAVADATLREMARQPVVLTVALPAGAGPAEVAAVVTLLEKSRGVAFAEPVDEEELAQLVEPWLGDAGAGRGLAIPPLIDVTFEPGFSPDVEALSAALRRLQPEVVVGRNEPADPRPAEAIRNLRALAALASVLFVGFGVAGVAAVTHLSLRNYAETVDLLQQMGAAHRYVARQFEDHAVRCGLRGGLFGFVLAAVILLAAIEAGTAFGLGLFPGRGLRPVDWVLLAAVPVITVLLTALAARLVAGRGLSRAA